MGSSGSVERIVVPAMTGKAFLVKKGASLRLTQQAGPQVIDFNAFSRDDPTEHFWAGRTRILERAHLTEGDRLWSVEPLMRPMFVVTRDTVRNHRSPRGARYHDLWFPRCNERYYGELYSQQHHENCHANLRNAVSPFGLHEHFVHDTLNVFMRTGLDSETDTFFVEETQTSTADFFELRAELDCLVALSACPAPTNTKINDVVVEIC